jgi:hypothetical protein
MLRRKLEMLRDELGQLYPAGGSTHVSSIYYLWNAKWHDIDGRHLGDEDEARIVNALECETSTPELAIMSARPGGEEFALYVAGTVVRPELEALARKVSEIASGDGPSSVSRETRWQKYPPVFR